MGLVGRGKKAVRQCARKQNRATRIRFGDLPPLFHNAMKVHHEQRGRVQYFCMGGRGDAPHRARDCCVWMELKRKRRELPRTHQCEVWYCDCLLPGLSSRELPVREGLRSSGSEQPAPSLAAIVHELQSGMTIAVICGAIRRRSQLQRRGVSSFRQLAQAGVTTLRTFNYFVGDHPPGTVFSACRKKQTRALKSLHHLSHRSAVKGLGDHFLPLIQPPSLFCNELRLL